MNRWRIVATASVALAIASSEPARAQRPSRAVGEWRPVADATAGWHAFGPVMLSITAVAGFGTGDLTYPEPGTNFFLLAAEPGIRGGRASVAWAHWMGFQGGVITRATVLRLWSDEPGRIWVGAELQLVISVLPVGVRIGAFRPTNEDAGARKTIWLADLSVMY